MEAWLIIELITIILSLPVLALSYYWLVMIVTSVRYPRNLGISSTNIQNPPMVTILIASFNEKFVIQRSLDAMKELNYPKDRLQIVVADDSTDLTTQIVDEKVAELNHLGISSIVSRRPNREYFKCGALNKAMKSVRGEYVLLLDADSIIPPDILTKGIDTIESHPRAAFVSFRYGHYNRNYNMVTRLFALSQDLGDTTSKMGAYCIDVPFSFQGGFTLIRKKDLIDVGLWSNERIADDADVSIKLYLKGKRGVYLSGVRIMSEDPSTLEAWKKQVARTSQGWWRCVARYWKQILFARDVQIKKKLGLLLMLMAPFSSLSWLIVTFLSTFGVLFNIVPPPNSIFSSPLFITVLAIPPVISLFAGAWALWVQGILNLRNAALIPLLPYANGSMLTLSSLGLFYGVFDRMGFFLYRTPKSGSEKEMTKTHYFQNLANDKNAIIEGVLAVAAIILAVLVLFRGVYFLSISMFGFGLFTIKSMNLTRHLRKPVPVDEKPVPMKIEIPQIQSSDFPDNAVEPLS